MIEVSRVDLTCRDWLSSAVLKPRLLSPPVVGSGDYLNDWERFGSFRAFVCLVSGSVVTGRAPVEPSVTSPRGVIITELVVELVVEPEVVPDPTVDFLEGPWYCCRSLVLLVNPKTPGDPVTFDGLWRVKMLSAVARRGSGIKSIKNFSFS